MSPDKRDRSPPDPTPAKSTHRSASAFASARGRGPEPAELAAILGIDESELAAIESGRVRAGPVFIGTAADALGVSVHWFFSTW